MEVVAYLLTAVAAVTAAHDAARVTANAGPNDSIGRLPTSVKIAPRSALSTEFPRILLRAVSRVRR